MVFGISTVIRKTKSYNVLVSSVRRIAEKPNGFLFNEKPRRPGELRKKEDWENIWVFGLGLSLLLGVVGYHYKPDTTLRNWAKNKALERIETRDKLRKDQELDMSTSTEST
ncbi:hypothetical protein TrispH2_000096 [Trichoplax sp. H2]|nr:hypothetical protein TrispH2_000096 [Trichoplax sp. H2]|eukprot:RDD47141.1 hypothetical protein TrispH2_000096 [Trichoplax sp. H2]